MKKKNKNIKTFSEDPNFSIVLPVSCNAKCKFCFWQKKHKLSNISKEEYIINLKRTLEKLPLKFYQVSITGGEPTLDLDLLEEVIKLCSKFFDKIVLTTNGYNLKEFKKRKSYSLVSFINISRHHYDDEENNKIFCSDTIPDTKKLKKIIGKDKNITFNSVINDATTYENITKFISFSKKMGVYSISFRKEHGGLDKTNVEKKLIEEYPVIYDGGCPVCKTTVQIIDDIEIKWKKSISEPSKKVKDVYELIYQPNGVITKDWDAKHIVELYDVKQTKKELMDKLKILTNKNRMLKDKLKQKLREQ